LSAETFENIVARLNSDPTFKDYFLKEAIREGKELKLVHRLREVGFFKPTDGLYPKKMEDGYSIPYWDVGEFLIQTAKTNQSKPDTSITADLKAIIEEVLAFDFGEYRNFYVDTVLIDIIFRLPINEIKTDYIEHLRVFFEKGWRQTTVSPRIGGLVLPRLIAETDREKILAVLRIILDYSHRSYEKDKTIESIMDEFWLKDALDKTKDGIQKLCGAEAADIGIEIIKRLHNLDESEFNIVWVPSIEMSSQISFAERYDYQLVSFVRDMLIGSGFASISKTIQELKDSPIPVLRRMAFHVIAERYDDFKALLWQKDFNPLADSSCSHEIMRLLEKNAALFTPEQLKSMSDHIEEHEFLTVNEDKEKNLVYISYKKKSWLKLLLPSGDVGIKEKYDTYEKTYPEPITEADSFPIYMSPMTRIGHVSEEELSQKNDEELVEYLNQESGADTLDDSRKMSKSDALTNLVQKDPQRFISGYKIFITLDAAYHYAIVRGINNGLKDGKRIEWMGFISYMNSLFSKDHDFGVQAKGYNYKNWLIGDVAGVFSFGSNNEELGYPADLLPQVEDILLSLFDYAENDYYDMRDVVTSVLNSTHGKIFGALIVRSLRYYRGFKKSEDYPGWSEKTKLRFITAIEDKNPQSPDARVILAEYLPQLFFHVDKDFVISRLDDIFLTENESVWRDTFGAYLVTCNVYDELFKLLNEKGFYQRAIASITERNPREKLMDHIVIAYLNGLDTDGEPLITTILNSRNYNDFSRIIHFIAWSEISSLKDYRKKVIELWDRINEILDAETNRVKEYYDAKGRLLLWFRHFSLPDEEVKKRILHTIRGMKDDFTISRFLELLVKFIETDLRDVVDIFKCFLEQGIYPYYPDKSVTLIFEAALTNGFNDDAQEILNYYSSRNIHGLKPIWDRYNPG